MQHKTARLWRRWIGLGCALIMVGTMCFAQEQVTLTMGSWRPDDAPQMNRILDVFHAQHPNITITYDATTPPEYDAVLRSQLEQGTGPDVFYLRSYSVSRQLYDAGYCAALTDLPGLQANFRPEMLEPWATDQGVPYGVPFIATSHGIYYNQDLFTKLNLTLPTTWEELLAVAQTLKTAGIIPFANASGDAWTINEIVLMNLLPNFIGGRDGRKAYLSGQRCFNDPHMVAALQAVQELAPFFPENHQFLMYSDSLQLFVQGKAAMWFGGSWDIPYFEAEKPAFQWSIMAVPPPKGQSPVLTFHLDAGMGLNAHSKHQAEAQTFLSWMTTPEFGYLLGNELPGFFPMHTQIPQLTNLHAQTLLNLNAGRGTDVRFAWEKVRDGSPDAYTLLQTGALAVLNGEQTPQQAADAIQAGLAQWFEPARNCKK